MNIFDRLETWLDNVPTKIKAAMNRIIVNGTTYAVKGTNISVKRNRVFVDRVCVADGLSGVVKIEFQGDLAYLDCNTATINGDVNGDVDANSLTVTGDVNGDIDCTSIKCGNVGGDVDGTTVTCGKVKGDVDAMQVKRVVKK
jgi:hypothetical protein